MPGKLLDANCMFGCSCGIPPNSPVFKPINPSSVAFEGAPGLLTDQTKLVRMVPIIQCRHNPSPSGGFLPCDNVSISGTWEKTDGKITISGQKVLTCESSIECPRRGKLTTTQKVSATEITTGGLKQINDLAIEPILYPALLFLAGNALGGGGESTHGMVGGVSTGIGGVGAFKDEKSSKPKKDVQADEYTSCPYGNCKENPEECPYFKTSADTKNSSAKLRANFKGTQELDEYTDSFNENIGLANKDGKQVGWSMAAHHVICGNQAYLAKDNTGKLLFGKLVKIAQFIGYDINCFENGILLPTTYRSDKDEVEPEMPPELARVNHTAGGYMVMSLMKRQWHEGGHSYKVSKSELRRFKTASTEIKRNIWQYQNTELFPIYASLVKAKLRKLQSKYRRERCWKKWAENQANVDILIGELNQISEEIRNALEAFSNKPQDSYPYYVSKAAIFYAFDIPKKTKLILIGKVQGKLMAIEYAVERLDKDGLKTNISTQGAMSLEDTLEGKERFVEFCRNIKHFCIEESTGYRLPFSSDEEDPCLVYPFYYSSDDYKKFLEDNESKILSFLEKGDRDYLPITATINRRKKTIG